MRHTTLHLPELSGKNIADDCINPAFRRTIIIILIILILLLIIILTIKIIITIMFWYQANNIRRNSWMTELDIEELERKVTGSDSVIVEEARSVEALPDHAGEDVRNALPEMGAEEQAHSLDEEKVAIIPDIAEVIDRGRKDSLPVLRNVPKTKLLEESTKVDKVVVLCVLNLLKD